MMWSWLASGLAVGRQSCSMTARRHGRIPMSFGISLTKWASRWRNKCTLACLHRRSRASTGHHAQAPDPAHHPFDRLAARSGGDYVYGQIKANVLLASISGSPDIISCYALGNPLMPVYRGELQCRGLGMKVEILDWPVSRWWAKAV